MHPNKSMDPIDIQYELKRAGISQAAIAKALKISESMVCRTIQGNATSKRVRSFIAARLNKTVTDIWPVQHNPDSEKSGH